MKATERARAEGYFNHGSHHVDFRQFSSFHGALLADVKQSGDKSGLLANLPALSWYDAFRDEANKFTGLELLFETAAAMNLDIYEANLPVLLGQTPEKFRVPTDQTVLEKLLRKVKGKAALLPSIAAPASTKQSAAFKAALADAVKKEGKNYAAKNAWSKQRIAIRKQLVSKNKKRYPTLDSVTDGTPWTQPVFKEDVFHCRTARPLILKEQCAEFPIFRNLGYLALSFKLAPNSEVFVRTCGSNLQAGYDSHQTFHPHVRTSGHPCFGDFVTEIHEARGLFDLSRVLNLAFAGLANYNDASRYAPLEYFDKPKAGAVRFFDSKKRESTKIRRLTVIS